MISSSCNLWWLVNLSLAWWQDRTLHLARGQQANYRQERLPETYSSFLQQTCFNLIFGRQATGTRNVHNWTEVNNIFKTYKNFKVHLEEWRDQLCRNRKKKRGSCNTELSQREGEIIPKCQDSSQSWNWNDMLQLHSYGPASWLFGSLLYRCLSIYLPYR